MSRCRAAARTARSPGACSTGCSRTAGSISRRSPGTSAGAMNAVALADGWVRGGPDGARQKLHDFWRAVAPHRAASARCSARHGTWCWATGRSRTRRAISGSTRCQRLLSPYVANPLDLNPLRDVVETEIDFDNVRACKAMKLFISATNVETGQLTVF